MVCLRNTSVDTLHKVDNKDNDNNNNNKNNIIICAKRQSGIIQSFQKPD
jgi:hypothetical protein